VGAYFDGGAASCDMGEMHIRHGGYLGVAPVPGGLTNACVVVSNPGPAALADPQALLVRTLRSDPILAPRFARAALVTRPVVLGPMAVDSGAAGLEGLLLAGDAAGFLDPMTGDGLHFALRGAEMAAHVGLMVLDGCERRAAAAALRRHRRLAFGRKWRMNRVLRSLVGSPRAVSIAARGARVCPDALRLIICAAGDVPRQARLSRS
jgi:flavin-dependent dehydrogenase